MRLDSNDIHTGQLIDPKFAFGQQHASEHMTLSSNLNPHLRWSGAPEGTRSYALLCVDPDVPSVADNVNQENVFIDFNLPRVDFYHWVMIDIDPGIHELAQGSCSNGVTSGGKKNPPGPPGSRQGLNDYTSFMAGGPMAGQYFGYDGPCPPWNDERLHHYHFTVHALAVASLSLPAVFDGRDALQAIQAHSLGHADIIGKYSLNPHVRT